MSEAGALLDCSFGLRFWGTRGSIPVSGAAYAAFGGDTTCFEIKIGARRLILDAGSGLRRLGDAMVLAGETDATLLFSHLHLDHVIGLTSFAPLFGAAGSIALHVPATSGTDPRSVLSKLFCEPFFPIGLEQASGRLAFESFMPGQRPALDGLDVATIGLRHGIGATGYRFGFYGSVLVILTDHEHAGPTPEPELVAFCRNADLIVYDAMWDETIDFERHRGWGHSTWQAGVRLLEAAGARRLACVHHAPKLSDAVLAEREMRLRQLSPESLFARQDDVMTLRP